MPIKISTLKEFLDKNTQTEFTVIKREEDVEESYSGEELIKRMEEIEVKGESLIHYSGWALGYIEISDGLYLCFTNGGNQTVVSNIVIDSPFECGS